MNRFCTVKLNWIFPYKCLLSIACMQRNSVWTDWLVNMHAERKWAVLLPPVFPQHHWRRVVSMTYGGFCTNGISNVNIVYTLCCEKRKTLYDNTILIRIYKKKRRNINNIIHNNNINTVRPGVATFNSLSIWHYYNIIIGFFSQHPVLSQHPAGASQWRNVVWESYSLSPVISLHLSIMLVWWQCSCNSGASVCSGFHRH